MQTPCLIFKEQSFSPLKTLDYHILIKQRQTILNFSSLIQPFSFFMLEYTSVELFQIMSKSALLLTDPDNPKSNPVVSVYLE